MPDLEPLFDLFRTSGWAPPPIPQAAHVVAYGHRLASLKSLPGVQVEAEATEAGIDARIVVAAGAQLALPLHLCFGLYQQLGVQNVRLDLTLEPASQATVLAHCLFATPLVARHAMQGEIRLMEGATLRHEEGHYHGTSGEIQVIPHARVSLEKGARYLADFSLLQGRVGQLDIDYEVEVGEGALAELVSRVYGYGGDAIRIHERLRLDGVGARGQVKTRVAVRDEAVDVIVRGMLA